MQAPSHFSYRVSEGECVLCDLQGGIYEDRIILADPASLTRYGNFGETDLGLKGIINFFRLHVCNHYCRSDWIKPGYRAVVICCQCVKAADSDFYFRFKVVNLFISIISVH